MKKIVHFYTNDPYNLLNLLAQIYYEKNIDVDEDFPESSRYALIDMLYEDKYKLTNEEWTTICKRYQEEHNEQGADEFLIGKNDDQGQYFCKQIQLMERYKKRKFHHTLRWGDPEYDYYVADLQKEEIYPCHLGEHYGTILFILKKDYNKKVKQMTPEELDEFVLNNFKLYGNSKSLKTYASDVVKLKKG